MLKLITLTVFIYFQITSAFATSYLEDYEKLKDNISNKYNIDFGINSTFNMQKINNYNIFQKIIIPYVTKKIFDNQYDPKLAEAILKNSLETQ